MDYPILVVPLPEDEGGGYAGIAPDLVGCISDGETPEEAVTNVRSAIEEWIDAARERGMDIPAPGSEQSRQRAKAAALAKQLKDLSANMDDIEDRLKKLETVAEEIEERLEHVDSWNRMVVITGLPVHIKSSLPALFRR